MKLSTPTLSHAALLGLLCALGATSGCKDDDPCDPDQRVEHGQCYAAAGVGGGGTGGGAASAAAGSDSAGAPDGVAGAQALDTPFGSECHDTTGSSDCGGSAPVCADLSPLGQTVFCTQIDCADGETNAGVCPSGFHCFAVSGYPSICIKG